MWTSVAAASLSLKFQQSLAHVLFKFRPPWLEGARGLCLRRRYVGSCVWVHNAGLAVQEGKAETTNIICGGSVLC